MTKPGLTVDRRGVFWGTLAVAVALVLCALGSVGLRSRAFVLLLLALLAVMTRGADYGGRMVYDYNAGGNACGQPIDFTR